MESNQGWWIFLIRYGTAFVLGIALTLLYHRITRWTLRWLLSGKSGRRARLIQAGFLLLFVFKFGLFFALAYVLIRWWHLNVIALIVGILVYETYRLLRLLLRPERYAEKELKSLP